MTTPQLPLAFIYDRCATSNEAMMELRLQACAEYVTEQGWGWGGWFVDKGDDALNNDQRPAFDYLVRAMDSLHSTESIGADRVCLVFDWGRLSHDFGHRQRFIRRVLLTGSWLATVSGQSVRLGEAPRSRPTLPLPPAHTP